MAGLPDAKGHPAMGGERMGRLRLFSFAALIPVLGLAACEGGEPTGPLNGALRAATINGVTLPPAPPAGLQPAAIASRTIGPLGGSIEVDGGRLVVPPGALASPVEITMRGRLDGRYQYRFGPDGLQFAVPATLSIQVDLAGIGVAPERLAIAVASDAGYDWRIVGGIYDSMTGTVIAQVHHFTQYAICQN
jgi:hypothetical protein